MPAIVKKRQRLMKLLGVFFTVIEMISDSAEVVGVVSKDLKEFVQSDSDQIPKSLNQISKITRSDEFSESVTKISRALTVGICRGYRQETAENRAKMDGNPGFSDRVLDKLFSDAGSGFVSVVVGSFAKNMVLTYYSDVEFHGGAYSDGGSNSESCPRWVDVLCEEKSKPVIEICVQSLVSTAVAVYLDKTMHINTYNEFFCGLTNPKHESQVRDMLVSVCNGAVETLVKSSHHVLTNSDPGGQSKSLVGKHLMSNKLKAIKEMDKNQVGDWLSKVSSAMAVSSNRRFVLDITGRVTFETVRSFMKFILEKISECLKRSVDIIHEEVFDKGVEAFRYLSRKSSAVVTICLSICLHILNGPWILVPT